MHVDSFFEYCLGHPHPYYTQLPPSGPFVSESRDGVPLEEDLALRALVPQWKPKRGRKRADERDLEEEKVTKRPSLDTSVAGLQQGALQGHGVTFPQSAIPFSAYPDDDPWVTASSSFPAPGASELRWRLPDRETTPAGYPQSAILPRENRSSETIISAEPRSAVTPLTGEKGRAKRRHGPAVSSAWPSSNGSATGKSRGRPPNKPSPGSTFPVASSRDSSQIPQDATPQPALVVGQNAPPSMPSSSYNESPTPANHARPGKLQLQVPQHIGAPVRLATPPTLLVNGVDGGIASRTEEAEGPKQTEKPEPARREVVANHYSANSARKISTEDIIHALSGELMRARLTGRPAPLTPDEARYLASAMVFNLSTWLTQVPVDLQTILLALQLGIAHLFGLAAPHPGLITVNAERCSDRVNFSMPNNLTGSEALHNVTRYSVNFEYQPSGHFSMQIVLGPFTPGSSLAAAHQHSTQTVSGQPMSKDGDVLSCYELEEDEMNYPVSDATWKQRYIKLRNQMQNKERALSQYKRRIVESVMADF